MQSDHINKKLKSGILWQSLQLFGQRFGAMIVGLVLARLLTPYDFGVFAMTYFFIAILEVFAEGGLGVALVQRPDIDDIDCRVVFTYNQLISLMCMTALIIAAPFIADFYQEPIVRPLTQVLAFKIPLDAIRTVSYAQMRRKLRFKALANCRLIATFISGTCGIALVFCGAGLWSLIFQQLTATVVMSVACMTTEFWRPRFSFSWQRLKPLWKFGGGLLLISLFRRAADNVYALIAGKFFSPDALGFYTRATSLEVLTAKTGTEVIGETTTTLMYRVQHDLIQFRRLLSNGMRYSGLFVYSSLTGLAVCASPLIECLLGKQWLPAAPMLQISCVIGAFYSLNYYMASVFKALGKTKIMVGVEMVQRILFVVLGVLGCFSGNIFILLWSGVLAYLVGFIINCHFCQRLIQYGFWVQMKVLWRFFVSCLIMAMVLVSLQLLGVRHFSAWLQMLILPLVGVVCYGGSICLLDREIRALVVRYMKKNPGSLWLLGVLSNASLLK